MNLFPKVRTLMSEGKGDRVIAETLDITRHEARKLIREVELADAQQGTLAPLDDMNETMRLDPEAWASRISRRWQASIDAIIQTGQLLLDAKQALPHGAFGKMIESDLPFGARTAQMLMGIATDKRLSNPKHVSHLPASWGTLAELTKLSDDEMERGFAEGIIRPDMLRADVHQLRPLLRSPGSGEAKGQPQTPAGSETADGLARNTLADTGEPAGRHHLSNAEMDGGGDAPLTAGSPVSAQMPSGGLAIAHQRVEPADSLDFFPTPPWATRALFEHVLAHLQRKLHCQYQVAWEPACGEGHMATVMREYFRSVLATDIKDYEFGDLVEDFLDPNVKSQEGVDWIITNPPFNTSTEFVLKALKLAGTGVAMFVRLTWLESVGRYERIFRDNPPTQLAIFTERVPLHKGRWESDGATMTAYIWLVWIKGAEPRAPFWIPPGCREALTKPDDAKRFGKSIVEGEAA